MPRPIHVEIHAENPERAIVEGLAERGYAILRDALPVAMVDGLRRRVRALDAANAFAPAAVGRARHENAGIRGDRIAWLRDEPQCDDEATLMRWLEQLRVACNHELMAGLADFEGHYAIYPPGARYERHRDRFRDDDARVLSCVLYVNDAWQPGDGGALRLYLPGDATLEILPEAGTFVVFLSARFDHEVLPATRERVAVSGWFRRRARI
jgi:SM-20-related protein